jgi:hypothetical protein
MDKKIENKREKYVIPKKKKKKEKKTPPSVLECATHAQATRFARTRVLRVPRG